MTCGLNAQLPLVLQKPRIRRTETVLQRNPGLPSQRLHPGHVQQLTRGTIWLAGVKDQFALKPHGLLHGFSQLANRHLYTGTNINVGTLGCSYRIGLAFCQPHHMDTGFSQVIDVQELAHGIARSPDNHLVQICSFCLVKPAHQRGDHVAVFSMKIVTFTIEVGWHQRPEVGAVLTVERLTQFDTGNLGNRTGFVGWLQSP